MTKVFLLYCRWIPEDQLIGVFATSEAARRKANELVGTPPGRGYHNTSYALEQFYIDGWSVTHDQ